MYRGWGAWEEALRVARTHGGPGAAHGVGYAYAAATVAAGGGGSGGSEAALASGSRILERLGMVEAGIEAACAAGNYELALDAAARYAKDRRGGVLVKRGMRHEDAGEYAAAEADFVAGGAAKEACDMYVHAGDYGAALRVADAHDPTAIPGILCAEAGAAAARGDYDKAERLYLQGSAPEAALAMYLGAGTKWHPQALRLCKAYLPERSAEVTDKIRRAAAGGAPRWGGAA
jgi:hypothetical protein